SPPRPGGALPGRAPTSTPPTTPRPPQTTVKPVIGSRPGSTGMAPAPRGPVPNPLARPVIGTRPSTTPSRTPQPPKRALIGKDGVIRSPRRRTRFRITRMPKTVYNNETLNRGVIRSGPAKPIAEPTVSPETTRAETRRLSRRDDETAEHPWKPDTVVVPGVITSRAPSETTYDPGPVANRRPDIPDDEPQPRERERRTIQRLSTSTPDDDSGDSLWSMPTAGRGVITNSRNTSPDGQAG
ncbi:MAG: hypothetical protein ACRDXX_16290, partial [Stackebrandtia sp.]